MKKPSKKYDFDKIQCRRCGRKFGDSDIAFELGKLPEKSECYACKISDLDAEDLKVLSKGYKPYVKKTKQKKF